MTYGDPSAQNKNKRLEQFADQALIDHITLLGHIGRNVAPTRVESVFLADAGPSKKKVPAPEFEVKHDSMKMDKDKLDKEIMPKVKKDMPLYANNKSVEEMSDIEKLDALILVLRVSNPFELERDSDKKHTPRTVEEVFAQKKWDCDELARAYIVVAKELGLTDFTQFEMTVRNVDSKQTSGHVALLFRSKEGGILYIDPAAGKIQHFMNYKTEEELVNSSEFKAYVLGVWSEYMGGKKGEIVEKAIVKGKDNADAIYHSEMGAYYFTQKQIMLALKFFEAGENEGIASAELYFDLGQCHSLLASNYEEDSAKYKEEHLAAVKYFNMAKEKTQDIHEKAVTCGFLAVSYLDLGKTSEAIKERNEQLVLASGIGWVSEVIDSKQGLANAYINLGCASNSDVGALEKFKTAEIYLTEVHMLVKENGLDATEIKEKFKKLYELRHIIYHNIGDETKIKENRENTFKSGEAVGIKRSEIEELLK